MRKLHGARSYFTARQLQAQDFPLALGLYAAQGRDSVWTAAQTPELLAQHAALWGGFLGRSIALCTGLCRADTPLPLLCEAMKTRLLPPGAAVFLPPGATREGAPYLTHFLQILLAHSLQAAAEPHSEALAALLPVKSGSFLAGAYFAAGLTLCAVRPLFQLRPHYIFLQTEVKNSAERSIMIPLEDTLSLSRLLEEGYAGTALLHGSVVLQRI